MVVGRVDVYGRAGKDRNANPPLIPHGFPYPQNPPKPLPIPVQTLTLSGG